MAGFEILEEEKHKFKELPCVKIELISTN